MTDPLATDPVVQGALRAGAALLFLAAGVHKVRDAGAFRAALAGYALLPSAWVPAAAAAVATVELAVGAACAVPASAAPGCVVGALLVSVYTLAVAWNLARGRRHIDCGCGGPGGRRPLSAGLVVRNAGAVALLALASLPSTGRPLVWLDAASLAAATALLALAYCAADAAIANAARLAPIREAA